jgi:hypothetical protein
MSLSMMGKTLSQELQWMMNEKLYLFLDAFRAVVEKGRRMMQVFEVRRSSVTIKGTVVRYSLYCPTSLVAPQTPTICSPQAAEMKSS